MKYNPINGWTKARIIETIQKRMKDHPALDAENFCSYLTPGGNRCAVGAFIPDGHPAQASGNTAYGVLEDFPDLRGAMPLPTDALSQMQCIHDTNARNGDLSDRRPALIKWVEENVEDVPATVEVTK